MEKNTFKVLARYNEVTYCKTTSEPEKHWVKYNLADFTTFSANEKMHSIKLTTNRGDNSAYVLAKILRNENKFMYKKPNIT